MSHYAVQYQTTDGIIRVVLVLSSSQKQALMDFVCSWDLLNVKNFIQIQSIL